MTFCQGHLTQKRDTSSSNLQLSADTSISKMTLDLHCHCYALQVHSKFFSKNSFPSGLVEALLCLKYHLAGKNHGL